MRYLNKGFTLLEMLVVLVIIGLLAGLVGPQLFGHVDESKYKSAKVQIKMLKGAIGALYLAIGRNPTFDEGLTLLVTPPTDLSIKKFWKGPYIEGAVPLDPWNHHYQYDTPGKNGEAYSLYSFGADGKLGGTEYNTDIGITSTQM
ncbi:MAG: type II secretion system major pseudopilin GspG [Thiomargarita sp.]|nr:type II secretion system major pseudopilin GspG [Thiomargarita sp.]